MHRRGIFIVRMLRKKIRWRVSGDRSFVQSSKYEIVKTSLYTSDEIK